MLTKKHIHKMFIRQEMSDEQNKKAEAIEAQAHQLALLIKDCCKHPNKIMEEAILHLKQAAMLARCCIAQEDREDY
jgi:hypothetical protein